MGVVTTFKTPMEEAQQSHLDTGVVITFRIQMEQAARVRRAMVVASAVINNLRLKHYPPSAGFLLAYNP
jgi:hypothetical protein